MPGGVCAVLDYETDMMAEYVAEMAMRIAIPNQTVTGAFRKFVQQILSSTRLPSTTILLGMNYLAKRVNSLNQTHSFKPSEGLVWKMLTVSLLLGSKFLDDNTFQNRSWSDVSGIAVAELNTMEAEWLEHNDWCLYVNLDLSHDYNAWLKSWNDWSDTKRQHIQQQQQQQQQQRSQAALRETLAPIVTSFRPEAVREKHHPLVYEGWTHEEIAEQERFNMNARFGHAGKVPAYRAREGSWYGQYGGAWPPAQAPLTPPDSGYGTPEYLNSAASVNSHYNEYFNQAFANGNYNRGYQQAAGHNGYNARRSGLNFHAPYYNHYGHGAWDANVGDCSCSQCMSNMHAKAAPYYAAHAFGQPVMG
ncbi:cyclin-like protein [Xylariomycetidae sp. FL0641]|nr:cyclin-like protein [Xylariomycetidae sp. FL0641]